MAEHTGHTPTPWNAGETVGYNITIEAADEYLVCDMVAEARTRKERAQIEANAAFIVRACNNYERCLEALLRVRYETINYPPGEGIKGWRMLKAAIAADEAARENKGDQQ